MLRDYQDRDFQECVELVNRVWEFDKHFFPAELADLFARVYTGGSIAASSILKVVEENSRVIGFLFGKVEGQKLYKNEYSGIRGQFRLLIRLFKIKSVSLKRKLGYLNKLNTHEINRRKIEPRKCSEVTLFVVDPDSQGKGWGKQLINEFISACKNQQKKRIVLETDKESNLGFYEHLGFESIGTFYSPLLKEFSGLSGDTFIYELLLE
jgi:GNAT superfamily N-acetyltransferase